MTPFPKSPLFLAFSTALLLVSALSLGLYLNEDWRTVALDMIEETVDEEGQVVRRVKGERPEPNRNQIREVTRERERKKREDVREQTRKVRDILVEMEEMVEENKAMLSAPGPWDQLAAMAVALGREGHELYGQVHHSHLDRLPGSRGSAAGLRDLADRNAREMRLLALSDSVTPDEAAERLEAAREIVAHGQELDGLIRRGIDGLEDERQKGILGAMQPRFAEYNESAEAYAEALARQVDAPEEAESEPEVTDPSEDPGTEESRSLAETLPTERDLEDMGTADLYEHLREMAELIDELFAENLAVEHAEFNKIPLEEAREQVHKPRTETGPDVTESLRNNDPASREEFRAFNEALEQASDAAGRIARSAETRRDRVRGASGEAGETRDADQLQSALHKGRRIQAEMARDARKVSEGEGNHADMRSAMGRAYGLQDGEGGGGSEGGWSGGGHASAFGQSQTGGGGESTTRLNRDRLFARAVPGRRFDRNSRRRGWIFLDTWYVIGPWQRPMVNSFDTIFPPETSVDLDETYSGKRHPATGEPMELEWRFVQSENVRINPPDETRDAVYYAYTEVYSETAMDVLLAVGADDASKLWINDLLVYQDDNLSGWRPDEGFRQVLLKPGYNTVLVRLENGPAVTYFSVILCPDEVAMP